MLVRKDMLLTVLHAPRTFAAVAELHLRVGKLRAPADHTFVLRDAGTRTRLRELAFKLPLPLFLLPRKMVLVEVEKEEHIEHRKNDLRRVGDT
jgi:hypothetical protein